MFLRDPTLTYFSSDAQGVKEGYDAVLAHHEELGFVPGGFQPEGELWLEDTVIARFEDTAVITAVWHFGNRLLRDEAPRGPLTIVAVLTSAGYRISHVNMGNYPPVA